MEIKYSGEYPERSTRNGARRTLNYNIKELSEEELKALWEKEENHGTPFDYFAKEHKYCYHTLTTGNGRWHYNGVVEDIIRDKYSQGDMEAITNNMAAVNAVFMQTLVTDGILAATKYLKDSIDEEQTANFKDMQEWRAMAKATAKSIFGKGE